MRVKSEYVVVVFTFEIERDVLEGKCDASLMLNILDPNGLNVGHTFKII